MKLDNEIHKIENIHVDIPYQWILRRLGYEKGDSPDSSTLSIIKNNVAMAVADSNCSGAFRIFKINSIKKSEIIFETNVKIKSYSISKYLSDCHYAAMIFATAGSKISSDIESDIVGEKMTEALIIDAAGSEIADAAIDEVQCILSSSIKKSGLKMKDARFSPGYGDFLLSNQKLFYKLLNMSEHKIKLTKTFQFIPEKTVTAICGLR
ncbi:MAG TPA: hypothetical protein PLN24_03120 [Victivallales bacterium]|nr:hypothetical protein [Victivallales bacterium]HPO90794.1 hypothetical protein [Victivallales bacterium]HRU02008.1 hypothetical protein [Victivallales bacterium]